MRTSSNFFFSCTAAFFCMCWKGSITLFSFLALKYVKINDIFPHCCIDNLEARKTVVITARIRRTGEGTVFSLSVHTSTGGGVPWGTPFGTGWGYPPPPVGTGWGNPPPPSQKQQREHLLRGGWTFLLQMCLLQPEIQGTRSRLKHITQSNTYLNTLSSVRIGFLGVLK